MNKPNEKVATTSGREVNPNRSQALKDYWRDVKSGARSRREKPPEIPKDPNGNPLFDLPEGERVKLYSILRDCPLMETIQQVLQERRIPPVTREQIEEFYAVEGMHYWEVRTLRAVTEADALVRTAEESLPTLSAGILNALAQQTFRLIASGECDPGLVSRIAHLFIKARSAERAEEMQGLRRRKLERELGNGFEHALDRLADEVEQHPAAKEAFLALRRELAKPAEEGEA